MLLEICLCVHVQTTQPGNSSAKPKYKLAVLMTSLFYMESEYSEYDLSEVITTLLDHFIKMQIKLVIVFIELDLNWQTYRAFLAISFRMRELFLLGSAHAPKKIRS